MSQDANNTEKFADSPDREYALMLEIERLESVREEMDEAGFSTLSEIEAALGLTGGELASSSATEELETQRALLEGVRADLLELGLNSYADVNDQITILHRELDELEGFDPDGE